MYVHVESKLQFVSFTDGRVLKVHGTIPFICASGTTHFPQSHDKLKERQGAVEAPNDLCSGL